MTEHTGWRMETRGVRDVMVPTSRPQTLAEFLLACFAEDEETARRASVASVAESRPPQGRWWSEWRGDDADQERGFQPRTFGIMEGMATLADVDADSGPGERGSAVAEHIVRHDPMRVLAECAAKRRMVGRASMLLDSWAARLTAAIRRWRRFPM